MTEVIAEQALVGPALELVARAAQEPDLAAELQACNDSRWERAEDVRKLTIGAVQLPDAAVHDVYERVRAAELYVVGGRNLGDYGEGSARTDDELLVCTTPGSVLIEAQHATDPVRKEDGVRGAADHGTGGLGIVLSQDVGGGIIVPRGSQTGNANVDGPEHPLKRQLLETAAGGYESFFAVHGCYPGKVTSLLDDTEIHGVIGLGRGARAEEFDRAERIVQLARTDLGLRVLVGNITPHLNFQKEPAIQGARFRDRTDELATNKQGQVTAPRLASTMPGSTVTFMREQTGLPASQIELSRSLRFLPKDAYRRPDPSAEAYGVFMGYQLCRLVVETR